MVTSLKAPWSDLDGYAVVPGYAALLSEVQRLGVDPGMHTGVAEVVPSERKLYVFQIDKPPTATGNFQLLAYLEDMLTIQYGEDDVPLDHPVTLHVHLERPVLFRPPIDVHVVGGWWVVHSWAESSDRITVHDFSPETVKRCARLLRAQNPDLRGQSAHVVDAIALASLPKEDT